MKVGLASLSVLLLSLAAFSNDGTLDSLLIKSVGGEKALTQIKNLKSYKMSGTINWNRLKGKYSSYFKEPDKIRINADFGTFTIEQGFDGQNCWQKDLHGRVFDLAGFEKKELMRNAYFMSFAYILEGRFPGTAELLDSFVTDRNIGWSVNFYPFLNDTISAAFEFGQNLHIIQFARLDNLTISTELSEFTKVEDVLFPFYSLSTAENTPMITEISVDSVVLNIDIADSFFSKSIRTLDDFYFPPDSISITIPIKFSNGHVMVYVQINGAKKGWFILDTGASATYYDNKFVYDLGLISVGELPSMGLGGFENIQLIQVDSLGLGTLTLYKQTAGVLPLDRLAAQIQEKTPFGGLLGYDFFMRFPVLFDFRKNEMTVFNPINFSPPENGISYPFHLSMMIPTIEAGLGGVNGNFLIDLGNALGLIIHPKFSEKLIANSAIDTTILVVRSLAGIGSGISGRIINIPALEVGVHKLNIPEAILAESSDGLTGSWEIAGNIGTKVLEQYSILFDYQNSRIIFYDYPDSGE